MSILNWVQTVCKVYQETIKAPSSMERIKTILARFLLNMLLEKLEILLLGELWFNFQERPCFSKTQSECQMVWIQIKTDILSSLIWIKTFCKCYQQMTKVTTSMPRISRNSFRNTIRVSNGLDPDQDRQNVDPDLCPNCLQMLSADNKSSL